MRVRVVFESVFGNTRLVAEAIAAGIQAERPDADVRCVPVAYAAPEDVAGADLLVVGGPTHMRTMTSRFTRRMGVKGEREKAAKNGRAVHAEPGVDGPGLREWLAALPVSAGRRAAVFDTRADMRFAGGAAVGIARRLRRRGYDVGAEPAGFFVDDSTGPLVDGELERARQWAAGLLPAVPTIR